MNPFPANYVEFVTLLLLDDIVIDTQKGTNKAQSRADFFGVRLDQFKEDYSKEITFRILTNGRNI